MLESTDDLLLDVDNLDDMKSLYPADEVLESPEELVLDVESLDEAAAELLNRYY